VVKGGVSEHTNGKPEREGNKALDEGWPARELLVISSCDSFCIDRIEQCRLD